MLKEMMKDFGQFLLMGLVLSVYCVSAGCITVNDNIWIVVIGIFLVAALIAMRIADLDPEYHSRYERVSEKIKAMLIYMVPVIPGVLTVVIMFAEHNKINKDIILFNIAGLLNLVASWLLIARFFNFPL